MLSIEIEHHPNTLFAMIRAVFARVLLTYMLGGVVAGTLSAITIGALVPADLMAVVALLFPGLGGFLGIAVGIDPSLRSRTPIEASTR